jgi:Ca-activated chloride channel family protein
MSTRAAPLLALLALILPPPPLAAQEVRPRPSPVTVAQVQVGIRIDGHLAQVSLELLLENPAPTPQEFDLLFPLGPRVTVMDLELATEGRTLEGTVLSAEAARRVYQEITQGRRDPALLEHYGEALYRARVFPVEPGAKTKLRLGYRMVVAGDGETAYIDAPDMGRLAVPLTAFRRAAGTRIEVEGSIRANRPISLIHSPTHNIQVDIARPGESREGAFRFAAESTRPDEAFVVAYKLARSKGLLDAVVLSEKPFAGEPGFFLALVQGLLGPEGQALPRDVVFVLDRSGSMKGRKIEQAREALRFLIERLLPTDHFNIITFATDIERMAPELVVASPAEIRRALAFAGAIEAGGSTHIEAALSAAAALFAEGPRMRQVIFLTDGLPTAGEQDAVKLARIVRERNPTKARIVAFGVGFDVNGALLDRLASQSRGLSEFVLPGENIEERVPGFYARMQRPVLADVTVTLEGTTTVDIHPKELSDLYSGHPLVITGRYLEPGRKTLKIAGRRGETAVTVEVPVELAAGPATGGSALISRIWAARKVGYLVDEIRLHGRTPELIDEVVAIGKRFGILTEYTSFLAAEGVDLASAAELRGRAEAEFSRRAGVESGAHGVAQAANAKKLQRDAAAPGENTWLDDKGQETTVRGCQFVNGQALFFRQGEWQPADLPAGVQTEEVVLFTPRCFEILDRHPEAAKSLARTGSATLNLGGVWYRFRPMPE